MQLSSLTPASALDSMYCITTLARQYKEPGWTPQLVLIAPGIAAGMPLAEVKAGHQLIKPAAYTPDALHVLDSNLSNPQTGRPNYRKAKGAILNPEAKIPGSRRIISSDGTAEVSYFRPWLSHWLINGLAATSDERLLAAGVVPGQDLEDRLHYKGGDLSREQYKALTDVLNGIVLRAAEDVSTPIPDRATLEGYLNGRVKAPTIRWWDLLQVFGLYSDEIWNAWQSRNEHDFRQRQGFYWSLRVFDATRRVLRNRHNNARDSAPSTDAWDYINAKQELQYLTDGRVVMVDELNDAVRVVSNQQIAGNGTHPANTNGRRPHHSPNGRAHTANLIVKGPKELTLDLYCLYNIYLSIAANHIDTLEPDDFNDGELYDLIVDLALHKAAIQLIPELRPFTESYNFTNNVTARLNKIKSNNPYVASAARKLADAVQSCEIDRLALIPEGTIQRILQQAGAIAEHIPSEMPHFITLSAVAHEIHTYLGLSKTAKNLLMTPEKYDVLCEIYGVGRRAPERALKARLRTLQDQTVALDKMLRAKYGERLFGYFGILLPRSHGMMVETIDDNTHILNGHKPDEAGRVRDESGQLLGVVPDRRTYALVLSQYGLPPVADKLPIGVLHSPEKSEETMKVRWATHTDVVKLNGNHSAPQKPITDPLLLRVLEGNALTRSERMVRAAFQKTIKFK